MIVQNSSPLRRHEKFDALWSLIDPEFPENQAKSPICGGTEAADAMTFPRRSWGRRISGRVMSWYEFKLHQPASMTKSRPFK
jgi:hypothetical protein